MPAVGEPDCSVEASTMPAKPASTPEVDQRHEPQAVHPDAGQPRGVGVESGGVQAPAGRGVLEQVPDRERDDDRVEDRVG